MLRKIGESVLNIKQFKFSFHKPNIHSSSSSHNHFQQQQLPVQHILVQSSTAEDTLSTGVAAVDYQTIEIENCGRPHSQVDLLNDGTQEATLQAGNQREQKYQNLNKQNYLKPKINIKAKLRGKIKYVLDYVSKRNANSPQGQNENCEQTEHKIHSYPNFLQTQSRLMFYLALSPLKTNGKRGSWAHMVLFIVVSGVALIFAGGKFKEHILEDAKKGNLKDYITAWYFFSGIVLRLYYLKLITMDYTKIAQMLQFPEGSMNGIRYKVSKSKVSTVVVLSVCLQIIIAVAYSLRMDWMIEGEAFFEVLLARGFRASTFLFIWERELEGNTTQISQSALLSQIYEEELTVKSVAMGIFGVCLHFFGNLQHNIVRDLLLFAAMHVFKLSKIFESNMQKVLKEGTPSDHLLSTMKHQHKTMFQEAIKIEESLGILFKFIHVDNWLFCSYFLLDLLRGEVENIFFIEAVITVPKILYIYVISARAITKTQQLENLIDEKYSNDDHDGEEYKRAKSFLKILKRNPIGVGRGQFQLDESFMSRFIGVVISCFILFADNDKKE